jgi:hypothetical protein
MSFLRRSLYVTIELIEASRVVRFIRSAAPFGDARSAQAELDTWLPALAGITPRELGVLLDFRLTPMTSDPDILRAVVAQVDAVGFRFPRRAILLARQLHGPQSERVTRAGASLVPFFDEPGAWKHVARE